MGRFKAIHPNITYCNSAMDVAKGADGLLIVTEWPEFRKLSPGKLKSAMNAPVVIDGRNLFDPAKMAQAGFTYHSVGRPTIVVRERRKPTQLKIVA
jgi:UDPglucose 6-dehydrogenase